MEGERMIIQVYVNKKLQEKLNKWIKKENIYEISYAGALKMLALRELEREGIQ